MAASFIGGENHRPAASHWQTFSHNVVTSTPRLSDIRSFHLNKYIIFNCLLSIIDRESLKTRQIITYRQHSRYLLNINFVLNIKWSKWYSVPHAQIDYYINSIQFISFLRNILSQMILFGNNICSQTFCLSTLIGPIWIIQSKVQNYGTD